MSDVSLKINDDGDGLVEEIPLTWTNEVRNHCVNGFGPGPKLAFPDDKVLCVENGISEEEKRTLSSDSEEETWLETWLENDFSYEDLKGDMKTCRIWMKQFGRGKGGWKQFRLDAIETFELFERRLKELENKLNSEDMIKNIMEMNFEEEGTVRTIISQIETIESDFSQASMIFEQFSQSLPLGRNRTKVESMVGALRTRFSKFQIDLYTQKDLLEWIIPRLKQFKLHASRIQSWLFTVEERCNPIFIDLKNNKNILQNEALIEGIIEEIYTEQEVYQDCIEPGKSVLDVTHQMDNIFLQNEINSIIKRWDAFCENIENCISRIQEEKEAVSLEAAKMKNWLITMQTRCNPIVTSLNNNEYVLFNEELIDEIFGEIHAKKDVFKDFLESGIICQEGNNVELQGEIEEIVKQWDSLYQNVERCITRITEEKDAIALSTSQLSNWLKTIEGPCSAIIKELNNNKSILSKEELIQKFFDDIHSKRKVYEELLESGKSITDHQIKNVQLKSGVDEIVKRWDTLNKSIQECLKRIKEEKDAIAFSVNQMSHWLKKMEVRSDAIVYDLENNIPILAKEGLIVKLNEEVQTKKDVYESFLESGKGIRLHQFNNVELQGHVDGIVKRWNTLSENLQKFKSRIKDEKESISFAASQMRMWLVTIEGRYVSIITDLENDVSILTNEEMIEELVNEINAKKDFLEKLLESRKGILDTDDKNGKLKREIDEIIDRWNDLDKNIEKCLNRIKEEKHSIVLELTQMSNWLNTMEGRCTYIMTSLKNSKSILPSEGIIEDIVGEIHAKIDFFEKSIESRKNILDSNNINAELREDIEEIGQRWNNLGKNIKQCLNRVKEEKENIAVEIKQMSDWFNMEEGKYNNIMTDIKNNRSVLPNEEVIKEMVKNICSKKESFKKFPEYKKNIIDTDNINEELRRDVDEIIRRWHDLGKNIEKCSNSVKEEKDSISLALSQMSNWLYKLEGRCNYIMTDLRNSKSILPNEGIIQEMIDEINAKKDAYEGTMDSAKGISDAKLLREVKENTRRWKFLGNNVNTFLSRIKDEKDAIVLSATQMNNWFSTIEERCNGIINDLEHNKSILPSEGMVSEIGNEYQAKIDFFKKFPEYKKNIIDTDNINEELRQDVDEVIRRWHDLGKNIEKCSNSAKEEKDSISVALSQMSNWLNKLEGRCTYIMTDLKNSKSILPNEGMIEEMVDEINAKNETFSDILDSTKGISNGSQINNEKLAKEMEEISRRWKALSDNIDVFRNKIKEEKDAIVLSGTEIGSWLGIVEDRWSTVEFDENKSVLSSEGTIEEIITEINAKKDIFEKFQESRKSISDTKNMNEDLRQEVDNIIQRWYDFDKNVEKGLNRIEEEKAAIVIALSQMSNWLNTMEGRCTYIISDLENNNSILPNEGIIDEIIEETHDNTEAYEDILQSAKIISEGNLKTNNDKLLRDVEEIVPQWDALAKNIEMFLIKIKEGKMDFGRSFARYKFYANYMKNWLNTTEGRCHPIMANLNNKTVLMENEGIVEEVIEELETKKDVYEDFLVSGRGILDMKHQMATSNDDNAELQQEVDDIISRWTSMRENIEKCSKRIKDAKKVIARVTAENRSDMEKIDDEVRDEAENCTCLVPFKIVKMADGKYTFGTSKIVRLLRIHGNSVVVRIGGGWEYISTFLLKVDPCRAKQHVSSNTAPPVAVKESRRSSAIAAPRSYINRKIDEEEKEESFVTSDSFQSTLSTPESRPERRGSCDVTTKMVAAITSPSQSRLPRRKASYTITPKSENRKQSYTISPRDENRRESYTITPKNESRKMSAQIAEGKSEHKVRRSSLVERQSLYATRRSSVDTYF